MSSSVINAAARIEQNQELNGSQNQKKVKKIYELLDGVARDKYGNVVEVNAFSSASPYAYKYTVDLRDRPVIWDQIQNLDPNLRMTKGFYMIKYTPRNSPDRKKGRPWKIGQDLIRCDIRVSGKAHWAALCERVPELDWLRRNSTLSDEMFDLAVQHPGMTLWFTVDWVRYCNKLRAQSESEAVQRQPLVARKVSVADYKKIADKDNNAIMCRYFNDILAEVNDAERLPAVQKEMIAADGEVYNRSRKNNKDPKTGRFIKKEK